MQAYESLKETKHDILLFDQIYAYIVEQLQNDKKDIATIDTMLQPFTDDVYTVSIKMLAKIMEQLDSEIAEDWNAKAFTGFVDTLLATAPAARGKLIVRRNRDIGKGTGTLLSPTDRALGDKYPEDLVLTMYKITGNKDKGWDGDMS